MNKLTTNLLTKREWGSEIIWALTDGYMAKTIEMPKNTQSPLFFNEEKDRSIIVINGNLSLIYGTTDDMKIYSLLEGWSWNIMQGMFYKYKSLNNPVRIIEVSTPHLENNTIIVEKDPVIYKSIGSNADLKTKKVSEPNKTKRKRKSKND